MQVGQLQLHDIHVTIASIATNAGFLSRVKRLAKHMNDIHARNANIANKVLKATLGQ